MELDPSVWSLLIAAVGLVGSVVAARYSKKSQDQSNETSKWEAMFKANEAQLARLSTDVAELTEKVDRLEHELQAKDKHLFWALTYVRELIRHWQTSHPGEKCPVAPEQIRDLI